MSDRAPQNTPATDSTDSTNSADSMDSAGSVSEKPSVLRFDQQVIASWITPGSRVLDLGCGDGTLLGHLVREKGVRANGIELDEAKTARCIAKGLSVVQGNVDDELIHYPDNAFEYVIVGQTLQQVHSPEAVVRQLLRVGKRGILSFPNFGYWRVRLQAMFSGRAPRTRELPYEWYSTPNIRVLTLDDFRHFTREIPCRLVREEALIMSEGTLPPRRVRLFPNLRASYGVVMVERAV